MRLRDSQPPPPAAPLRVLSGLLALLVFALACAVQSPAAHAWLHGATHDTCAGHADSGDASAPQASEESGCPVTLIAQGFTLPLSAPDLPPPSVGNAIPLRPTRDAPALAAPARLHPPAQAPPTAA